MSLSSNLFCLGDDRIQPFSQIANRVSGRRSGTVSNLKQVTQHSTTRMIRASFRPPKTHKNSQGLKMDIPSQPNLNRTIKTEQYQRHASDLFESTNAFWKKYPLLAQIFLVPLWREYAPGYIIAKVFLSASKISFLVFWC
jgi:hypothetical protein